MKIKKETIEKYYDSRSACQVLGCLMLEPQRLSSREMQVAEFDFVSPIHKTLFISIYNLSLQGLKTISLGDVETYLANNNPVGHKKMFEEWNGAEWITSILEDANVYNYDYYYWIVRKFSFLRIKMQNGQDVSTLLDMTELDCEALRIQRENFDLLTIDDIIRYFDSVNLSAKRPFVTRAEEARRKAGDNAFELLKQLALAPSFGFATESAYLNTIMRGLRRGTFMLETRDSGQGKTRVAIKRLLLTSAPYLWDFKKRTFVRNPHTPVASLYIGTEMDLYTELEPMMWAFLSGVDEDKIHANTLTPDERQRVERAIKILQDTPLYLEDEENYDISFLSHTIEHYKTEYNIGVVAIDYLELTSALTTEFTHTTRGMGVREDQVLLNLSTNVKNMAKRFDIAMIGFTQTTDLARAEGVRDQRAVKGARSLPNKCDLGMTSFAPTKQEIELLEPLIEKCGLNNGRCVPNIGYNIYKNRGGKFKNIKIWGYQDLGTMEYVDLFCTDESYAPINVDKTHLMPNIVALTEEEYDEKYGNLEEQEIPEGYALNDETGELVEIVDGDVDIDTPLTEEEFQAFQTEDEEDELTEEEIALKEYEEQVKAYNDAMMAQYEGDESHVLQYDENGLLQAIPVEFEPQEEVAEAIEELKDPFAELPIIDDSELDFLSEEEPAPTLGARKRIGF